jgi:hypothetical protein
MQAPLRGIDRHQAQPLGVQDFHGRLGPQVCRILTADRRDPMAVVPLRRPPVGLGGRPGRPRRVDQNPLAGLLAPGRRPS